MFIPYKKIERTLSFFYPKHRDKIVNIFEYLRVQHNVRFIKRNEKKVLTKLRKKNTKIKVAFLCNEPAKWKCQTLYDLMQKDNHFEPFILATRMFTGAQTNQNVITTYDFFKSKGMNVKYAYDLENNTFLHAKDFNADIIFYQQPWANETTQGPVIASQYAKTYYVPYFISPSHGWIEHSLRFHSYIQTHYVLNDMVYKYFCKVSKNKGKNLKICGNPQLDYYYLNKDKDFEKKYVIYAPHHSINDDKTNWATFVWSAEFMLKYAQEHPEINWVFRPHPNLRTALHNTKTMTKEEMDKLWEEWGKIAIVSESGDYLDLFMQSKAMITDCGSFLTEYFLTCNPMIHLERDDSVPFNENVQKNIEAMYRVKNIEELKKTLDQILIQNLDPKKEERKKVLNEIGYANIYSAEAILNDIKKDLKINE